jgi:hypothetical protein
LLEILKCMSTSMMAFLLFNYNCSIFYVSYNILFFDMQYKIILKILCNLYKTHRLIFDVFSTLDNSMKYYNLNNKK